MFTISQHTRPSLVYERVAGQKNTQDIIENLPRWVKFEQEIFPKLKQANLDQLKLANKMAAEVSLTL